MIRDDFCVFILTHGRADNVITYKTLNKQGYTGKIFFVVDNEDGQADLYIKNFGEENVLIFDKLAISKTFDTADTFNDRRTIVYARNACFKLARENGYKYFLELDDDYTSFEFRYSEAEKLKGKMINDLDGLFSAYIDFLNSDLRIKSVAMAQGGGFYRWC